MTSLPMDATPKKRCAVRAFTLIELLVVVSIIALLVSILLPALAKAREQAKRTVCAAQFHQLGVGASYYTENYNGKYPYGNWFNFPFATYVLSNNPSTDYLAGILNISSKNTKHVGGAIREYIDDDLRLFYCPASPLLKDSYWRQKVEKERQFIHAGGGNDHIGYLYFGNYVTKENGMLVQIGGDELINYKEGYIYPMNTSSKRAILFADIITNHWWIGVNHPYPNALYTDGSVEGRLESTLPLHNRAGNWWCRW